jgi:iron complex outermembrane recepter protein
MGSWSRVAVGGTLLALAFAGEGAVRPLAAQQGTIVGTVTESAGGSALPGALVTVGGVSGFAQTDGDGHFRLTGVPAGVREVKVVLVGYTPARRSVTLPAGAEARVDVALSRAVAQLQELTVIGTQKDIDETRRRLDDVPGAVALIPSSEIRATRQANLKDALRLTPGVFVQPRFGAADESQISIRGSGLRNNFHARGINLLVNGMPYRNADGFTDFESLELLNTESIEVYKGGNALRYGGSTLGGAINLQTRTGYSANRVSAVAQAGSYGFFKGQLASGGTTGPLDYYASYSRTSLDGYRQWSEQGRDRVNAHLGYVLSPTTDLRSFYFFARVREHLPGALSATDFLAAPRSAVPNNVTNRWGREYDLHHVGVQLRSQLSPTQRLEVSPYFQYRDIDHPIFQVIAQQSRDYGAEVRYENTGALFGRANRLTVGVQPAYQNMDDRQYQNVGGEHGALTKDQQDEVFGLAAYLENLLALTPRLSVVTGLRFDHSVRKASDFFLSNGDQSDSRRYDPLLPKVGLLYSLPSVNGQLFANASRSFEPPLLLELNSLTVPGFVGVRGQDAWQFEVGTRGRSGAVGWDVSAFDIELTDEILNVNVQPFLGAPFTVPTYRNAARTRHYGVETGLDYQVPRAVFADADRLGFRVAYTWSRYRFVEDESYSGNEIPGAPSHHLSAEVKYTHPAGFSFAPSFEWVPRSYFLNSANTVRNGGWTNIGLRADWTIAGPGVTLFMAAQNLAGRNISQSAQVDNAAGQYYEPSDGRSFYAGARWNP